MLTCKIYAKMGACATCQTGYTLNASTKKCTPNIANCATYASNTKCSAC